ASPAALALPQAPEPPPLPAGPMRGPPQPGRPILAADPALLESGPYGPLPRISAEGRTPIRTYGRPFDRQDPRSKIGLVVGGLGINAAISEEAIARLPGGVALAFSPYAPQLPLLLDQARRKGMELLVALPLEPTGYPLNNPGDRALLTGNTEAQNEDRLAWVLSRFTGYVGAIGALGAMRGERYAAVSDRFGALQDALRSRGLLYIDPRPGARPPERAWGRAIDLVVDEPATRGEIELKLQALERLAQEKGAAIGYAGNVTPVVIDRLASWAGSLEARGFVLAPVTALRRAPDVAAAETVRAP
ncbi:divergent polysaccharide deacetylase family protein, partial [Siccirubricoccus sp. KC 17139]